MKTFIRVRSEYFELDDSKYRLFVTEHTLIQSLIRQNNKNFIILLSMSPMDPCYSRRRKLFDSVGVDVWHGDTELRSPRIEIRIGDDDFLCGNFVNVIQRVPVQMQNTELLCPRGYIFHDGKLRPWKNTEGIVRVQQIVQDDEYVCAERLVSESPAWIYVRHNQNLRLVDESKLTGEEVTNLNWPGWNPRIVSRIGSTRIVTASAQGCEAHPTRSKSVVFANASARQRRKK